jgi:hypothetical protein
MDEQRKKAYRYMLYHAMIDIRPSAWMSSGVFRILNPLYWRHVCQRVRRAGVVADWLHNLALFSALDFEGFDEEWFWGEFQKYETKYPAAHLATYKEMFEEELSGQGHIGDE